MRSHHGPGWLAGTPAIYYQTSVGACVVVSVYVSLASVFALYKHTNTALGIGRCDVAGRAWNLKQTSCAAGGRRCQNDGTVDWSPADVFMQGSYVKCFIHLNTAVQSELCKLSSDFTLNSINQNRSIPLGFIIRWRIRNRNVLLIQKYWDYTRNVTG